MTEMMTFKAWLSVAGWRPIALAPPIGWFWATGEGSPLQWYVCRDPDAGQFLDVTGDVITGLTHYMIAPPSPQSGPTRREILTDLWHAYGATWRGDGLTMQVTGPAADDPASATMVTYQRDALAAYDYEPGAHTTWRITAEGYHITDWVDPVAWAGQFEKAAQLQREGAAPWWKRLARCLTKSPRMPD